MHGLCQVSGIKLANKLQVPLKRIASLCQALLVHCDIPERKLPVRMPQDGGNVGGRDLQKQPSWQTELMHLSVKCFNGHDRKFATQKKLQQCATCSVGQMAVTTKVIQTPAAGRQNQGGERCLLCAHHSKKFLQACAKAPMTDTYCKMGFDSSRKKTVTEEDWRSNAWEINGNWLPNIFQAHGWLAQHIRQRQGGGVGG